MNSSTIKILRIVAILCGLGTASTADAALIPIAYAGPSGGLWSAASNWSPAVVPANSGSNSYSVDIAANPVVFNIAGSTAINDLTLANALTLNAGCSLSASGQISFSGASITSNGGSFTASGPAATATNLDINASGGAQVALPAITQITENAPFFTLQANGANTLLDLSHVTTISADIAFVGAQSSTGNEVNLHNLLSVSSTNGNILNLIANGGTIDVSSLGGGTTNSGVGSVSLSNSGTVLWGNPTNVNSLNLSVTGTGNSINVGNFATATNLALTAAGGAQLALPALTQFTQNNFSYSTVQASGTGSLLNLSSVTSIAVNVNSFVQSSSGNEVNLHNLLSVTSTNGNSLNLTANGGTIDVSSLGGGTTNSGVGSVSLSNSGTVLWGNPTNVNSLNLTVTGTGNSINVGSIATATNLALNAAGGAQLALPALTQITQNNFSYSTVQASGTGSLLNLSSVTSIAVDVDSFVQTSSGNEVNLHNLLSVTTSNGSTLSLSANGGTIDVSSLKRFSGSMQIGGGGVLLLGGSGSISGGMTVTGGSTAGTQGTLIFAGAIGTVEFTDPSMTDTDVTLGGSAAGDPAILDFRLGGTADHLLLDAGKFVVNPGGAMILITPAPGISAGTYDVIDFRSGQASGLGGLALATTSLPGYTLSLHATPTSEQLVVTAVPEPSAVVLLTSLLGGLLFKARRGNRAIHRSPFSKM